MILTGVISAKKFVDMTADEMASDEVKALRKKLTDEAITSHQLAVQQGTETDMFKCNKCKSSKCTYTQLQTRSSDEPMTTFVCCLSCGNRWKVRVLRFLGKRYFEGNKLFEPTSFSLQFC